MLHLSCQRLSATLCFSRPLSHHARSLTGEWPARRSQHPIDPAHYVLNNLRKHALHCQEAEDGSFLPSSRSEASTEVLPMPCDTAHTRIIEVSSITFALNQRLLNALRQHKVILSTFEVHVKFLCCGCSCKSVA